MLNRRKFLRYAGLAAASAVVGGSVSKAAKADRRAKPNILLIIADDCTHNDLPIYGGKNAATPNIDRLASEGLVFNRAYLGSAMCQPCRAELYTGLYQMRNGCAWNHSASRPDVTSMPHHLRALGYRVGLAGKVHVKPAKIKLPPNIADTPRTREAFSRYLAEITWMDGQVGDILKVLDESGRADNTLVLLTSEQGSQFPGCKWTNWDTGLHTALIARWPGKIAPEKRTNALVQYADVLPTLIDAVGGSSVSDHTFDGTSFLSVLLQKKSAHRKFAYGMHNNIPEGPAYPIRTISDGQYRYIRNLRPDEIYIEKHLMGWSGNGQLNNPYWATWVREAWNDRDTYNLVKRYMHRPAEQLYHTAEDPYEMTNLAGAPALADVKAHLSAELDRWMAEQGDPGAPQDTHKAIEAARRGKHIYGGKD